MTIDHPSLGLLRYSEAVGVWVGHTANSLEICIGGDHEELDPECEALALKSLSELDSLLTRIEAFLATAREPYLDQWGRREWQLHNVLFSREADGPTFVVEYLLDGDDYTIWLVRVESGEPVSISWRSY